MVIRHDNMTPKLFHLLGASLIPCRFSGTADEKTAALSRSCIEVFAHVPAAREIHQRLAGGCFVRPSGALPTASKEREANGIANVDYPSD